MKKIKSFRIKNCERCFEYQKYQYSDEKWCPWHRDQADQPRGISKSIQQAKKEWREQIFLSWLFLILIIIPLYLSITAFSYFPELNNLSGKFYFCFLTYFAFYCCLRKIFLWIISLIERQKEFQQELKELNQKKREWIIEYE